MNLHDSHHSKTTSECYCCSSSGSLLSWHLIRASRTWHLGTTVDFIKASNCIHPHRSLITITANSIRKKRKRRMGKFNSLWDGRSISLRSRYLVLSNNKNKPSYIPIGIWQPTPRERMLRIGPVKVSGRLLIRNSSPRWSKRFFNN